VRISKETTYSPLSPRDALIFILGLEPLESLRMLYAFGNETSFVVSNTRPYHTMAVVVGEAEYPRLRLSRRVSLSFHKRRVY